MESKEEFKSIRQIEEEELDDYFLQDRELIERDFNKNWYDYEEYDIDVFKGIYYKQIIRNHNYNKAKEYFDVAITRNNKDAYYHLGQHYTYCLYRDEVKREEYFRQAAELNSIYALRELGHICWERQDMDQAREYFERADKLGLKDYLNLAAFYECIGETDKMIEYNIKGKDYHTLGVKFYEMKNYKKAKEYYELALTTEKYPDDDIYAKLGMLYYNIFHDYKSALNYFFHDNCICDNLTEMGRQILKKNKKNGINEFAYYNIYDSDEEY